METSIKKALTDLENRKLSKEKTFKKIMSIINIKKIITLLANIQLIIEAILFYLENNKKIDKAKKKEIEKIIKIIK